MSYPQGYLYQPSASLALYSCPAYSTSVISGPRTDELGRSSSGSAFSPYAGSTAFSAPSPGYNSHLQYGTDPAAAAAAAFSSYVGSPYDHTPGMAGSLGYHPYAAPLGSYPYGDPAYRKNATRDATATLKAWLNEHRKNPYPTKGEKIMLAIITKMTLTQVSTWFANARRRLKKENKMTWTPRNRSEDEEEEENIDLEKNDEDEPQKLEEKSEPEATEISSADPKSAASGKDADGTLSDSDCKDSPQDALSKGVLGASPPLAHCVSGRLLLQAHPQLQPGGGEDPQPPHPLPAQYRPPSAELHPILPPQQRHVGHPLAPGASAPGGRHGCGALQAQTVVPGGDRHLSGQSQGGRRQWRRGAPAGSGEFKRDGLHAIPDDGALSFFGDVSFPQQRLGPVAASLLCHQPLLPGLHELHLFRTPPWQRGDGGHS
ncbi:hypothetical protein lerEdw1_000882 [Lerista edwardsae]|nr:hypothetical protein lerEdw1_000882 [Lerista edwardsae]